MSLTELRQFYAFNYVIEANYNLPQFRELNFGLLAYNQEMIAPVLMCAIEENSVLCVYAVLHGNGSARYVIYDTDGDGIFDYQGNIKTNYIPNWVLFRAKTLRRGKVHEFLNTCDAFYKEYNSTKGPRRIDAKLKAVSADVYNPRHLNRDLFYALLAYHAHIRQPELAFKIMYTLQQVVRTRANGQTPPLLFLYMGETMLALGNDEWALQSFRNLKMVDPKSIIAEYYIAKLEDKRYRTSANIIEFKKKYPKFWAAKKK